MRPRALIVNTVALQKPSNEFDCSFLPTFILQRDDGRSKELKVLTLPLRVLRTDLDHFPLLPCQRRLGLVDASLTYFLIGRVVLSAPVSDIRAAVVGHTNFLNSAWSFVSLARAD